MLNVVQKIKTLWNEFKMRRAYSQEIAPQTIGDMAKNLIHLIELVERGTVLKQPDVKSLRILKNEMLNLEKMTENKGFNKLSADRRLALHQSLLTSEDKLLTSMQSSESLTERIQ